MSIHAVLEIKLDKYDFDHSDTYVENVQNVATFVGEDSREQALQFIKDLDNQHKKSCEARKKYVKEYVDKIELPEPEEEAKENKVDQNWLRYLSLFSCFRHSFVSRKNFKKKLTKYLYKNDYVFNSALEKMCGSKYDPPKIITDISSDLYVVEMKEPEQSKFDLSWMDNQIKEVLTKTLSQDQLDKMNEFYQRQRKSKDLMVGVVKDFFQKMKDDEEKET